MNALARARTGLGNADPRIGGGLRRLFGRGRSASGGASRTG